LAAEEAVEVAPVGTCSPQKGNNIAAYMICWSYFWLCAQELPVFTVSEGAKVFAAWDLTGLKGHYSNADSSPPSSSSKGVNPAVQPSTSLFCVDRKTAWSKSISTTLLKRRRLKKLINIILSC